MPNQFICNLRGSCITILAVAVAGASQAQTGPGKTPFDANSIKPSEWTANLKPAWGNAAAPIKVVFFVDYQCPPCRSADRLVRKAISKRKDVALIYREFPLHFHPLARSAAAVAENARAHGTFEIAHRRLMEGEAINEASVKDAAHKSGVPTTESPKSTKRIDSDHQLEQKAALVSVPTFIVIENGKSTQMTRQQILDFLK